MVKTEKLGDGLYRLHQPAEAVAQWKRSLHRIEESETEREDLKSLRTVLQTKLKQQEQGHPVELSPQNNHLRRLQHELVERSGLASQSRGQEPYRRVVVFLEPPEPDVTQ